MTLKKIGTCSKCNQEMYGDQFGSAHKCAIKNTKLYTIEQVEDLVDEANYITKNDTDSAGLGFAKWWENKKQEMEK